MRLLLYYIEKKVTAVINFIHMMTQDLTLFESYLLMLGGFLVGALMLKVLLLYMEYKNYI